MSKKLRITLILWSQLAWFGCVYFAKRDYGPTVLGFAALAWVLLFFYSEKEKINQYGLVAALAILGLVFDFVALKMGWITILNYSGGLLPYWLVAMWFVFVTVLPILSQLFEKKVIVAGILGFIFGPLTYKSGEAFEVMTLNGWAPTIVYAIFWSSYLVFSIVLLRRHRFV